MTFLSKQFWAALLVAVALPALSQVSRDEAAAQAQQQTGGRVLSVELSDAGAVWRVKVVTPSGEVRVVKIDAGTQRRLHMEEPSWLPDIVWREDARSSGKDRPVAENQGAQ